MGSSDAGRSARRRVAGWVCALLLLGLTLTIGGAGAARHAEHQAAVAGAGRRTDLTAAAVRAEIRRYEDTVTSVAAALSAQEHLDREAFETITKPLVEAQLKGVSGVDFVVPANDGDTPGTQAYWRQRGEQELTLQPAGHDVEHLFTIFSRSLDGTPARSGRDLSSSDAVAQALVVARRSGRATVSSRYVPEEDRRLPAGEQQAAFVLAAGVDDPATGVVRGWAVIGLRAGGLLRGTLDSASQRAVNATLTATDAEGHPAQVASEITGSATNPALMRRQPIRAAQDRWMLQVHSTDQAADLDTGGGYFAVAVLAGGAAVSVLLAGVLFLLLTSRLRALAAVEAATAEMRHAEADARRQAALLTAVLDSISDGVSVVDEQGGFLVHNPAARAIFGVDRPLEDAEHWQQRFSVLQADGVTPFPVDELPLTRALRGEVTDHIEMVVRHPGKPEGTPVSVSGRPLDARAGTAGAVAVFHDISARLDAARELRAAEERFRFAFDHAHVGMAMSEVYGERTTNGDGVGDGRILRVNDALCAVLGYTPAEMLNRSFVDLTHPDDRSTYVVTLAGVVGGEGNTLALEKRMLHADGHIVWALVNSTIIRGPRGEAQYAITQIEDITQRRAETERLAAMALQDPLTGLGNRVLLRDRLEQAAARTARSGQLLAVLFCDLDGFKPVNDTHGHAAGDEVLREVARRIRETVRPADTVARLGGDEFVVLCEDLIAPADVDEIAGRIQAALQHPVTLMGGTRVIIACSIGLAMAAGPGVDVEHLLQHADAEMYGVKRAARLRAAVAAARSLDT